MKIMRQHMEIALKINRHYIDNNEIIIMFHIIYFGDNKLVFV